MIEKAKRRRRKRGPLRLERYNGVGPIQLWQFILELLLKKDEVIEWTRKKKMNSRC